MFNPFFLKQKYKLKSSKEVFSNVLQNHFTDMDEFKYNFRYWSFKREKIIPLFAISTGKSSYISFTIRGEFVGENEFVLKLSMEHLLIISILSFGFMLFMFFHVKPSDILIYILFFVFFIIVMTFFVKETLKEEKDFLKKFEKSLTIIEKIK